MNIRTKIYFVQPKKLQESGPNIKGFWILSKFLWKWVIRFILWRTISLPA